MHAIFVSSALELVEAILTALIPAGVIAGLLKVSGDWWKTRHPLTTNKK